MEKYEVKSWQRVSGKLRVFMKNGVSLSITNETFDTHSLAFLRDDREGLWLLDWVRAFGIHQAQFYHLH